MNYEDITRMLQMSFVLSCVALLSNMETDCSTADDDEVMSYIRGTHADEEQMNDPDDDDEVMS